MLGQYPDLLLFEQLEIALSGSAYWAYPVVRNSLECRTRIDPAIRIANCWIVDPAADLANVLSHDVRLSKQLSAMRTVYDS